MFYRCHKKAQEKCGIVALYTNKPTKNLSLGLLASGGIQHRGQQGAGIALQTDNGLNVYKGIGLLREIFTKDVISKLDKPCRWLLLHCRYGTHGNYKRINLQPCISRSTKGDRIAVVHNGEFVSIEDLKKEIKSKHLGVSDTYLFTQALALTKGINWEEKIVNFLKKLKGAYSLAIGVNNSLFIARDEFGIRPLVLGEIGNGYIVASETHALDKVGARLIREVNKGEIIKIDKIGLTILKKGSNKAGHFCDLEWAYFSRPDSIYRTHENSNKKEFPNKWFSFAAFREKCGKILAREVKIANASFVVGVPDSGISVATGYAGAAKIPYRQVIIRDHFDPNGLQRLFMGDDQIKNIGEKVLGKLSLVPDVKVWHKKIVVVGDDSIVRGNVSTKITKAIFSLGAKEVHWIIGFPPVVYPCHLGVSMRSQEELIAAHCRSDKKKIAQAIGATSVNYISNKGFIQAKMFTTRIKACQNSKEIFLRNGGCGGCLTGIYPVSKSGRNWRSKLRLAILIGSGSRLPAIYRYVKKSNSPYEIAVVVSYKKESPKITWSQKRNIPAHYHRWFSYRKAKKSRVEYNQDLINLLKMHEVDLVFGVGWDIIWTSNFLKAFPNRVLNAHPFPLPDKPVKTITYRDKLIPVLRGMDALKRAYKKKLPITGACVHFARETVDMGPVVVRDILPIKKGETFEELERRHCQFEGKLLVKALKVLSENRIKIINEQVELTPNNY